MKIPRDLRIGLKVWYKPRHAEGKQPNGYISRILWGDDREVVVKFHDSTDTETFTWDDLEGTWTDKFGGTFMLYQ